VFSQCRPVVVNFSAECDAFVEKKFRDTKRSEAERARRWELQWKEEQVEREQERIDRLKAHPRCEEWDGLSVQELERLVWSMPTTKIAAQFGVSDSAIGKRRRMAGIKKPPPGFWARVEAGKVPHPNGRPHLRPIWREFGVDAPLSDGRPFADSCSSMQGQVVGNIRYQNGRGDPICRVPEVPLDTRLK
jgi:hypothetical protein